MGSFSSFLSDAGDFLSNTVAPIALGFVGAQLGLAPGAAPQSLAPAGGSTIPQVPIDQPATLTATRTALPFGLTPLMIGLIIGGIILLLVVLM